MTDLTKKQMWTFCRFRYDKAGDPLHRESTGEFADHYSELEFFDSEAEAISAAEACAETNPNDYVAVMRVTRTIKRRPRQFDIELIGE